MEDRAHPRQEDRMYDWALEFPAAVTVCDRDFTIIYMNDKSARTFEKEGGRALLGKDLRDCHHADKSKNLMARILETGEPNAYTIEKKGLHKFIYQAPWYEGGKIAGLVEISMETAAELPHFVRG
jgi:transcriptional regulator with PAS, ATPase and Fis domain